MELETRARDIVVIDIGSMTILCCRCSFVLWGEGGGGRFYIYIYVCQEKFLLSSVLFYCIIVVICIIVVDFVSR